MEKTAFNILHVALSIFLWLKNIYTTTKHLYENFTFFTEQVKYYFQVLQKFRFKQLLIKDTLDNVL